MSEVVIEEGVEEQADGLPELPEGWEWRPLISLLEALETGKRPKGGVAEITEGVPSLGGEHLRPDGTISLETIKFVPRDFFSALKKGIVRRGDVLVVKDGATTGKTALVDSRFEPSEAAVNEHVFLCRAGDEMLPEYLFYFLWSGEGQRQIQENIRGAAQGGITRAFADAVMIPTPALERQRFLVAELKARLGEISALNAQLDVVKNLQNQFRQALLRDAFTGRLTHGDDLPAPDEVDEDGRPVLPKGWEWKPASSLTTKTPHSLAIGPFGSNLKVSDYQDDGIPLVLVADIRSQEFGGSGTRFISQAKAEELAAHQVNPGDVLITKMGDPPGDAAIYPADRPAAIVTADCIRFQVDRSVALPRFIELSFSSHLIRQQVLKATRGVAQRKMSLGRFREIEFPTPPVPLQEEILKQLELKLDAQAAILAAIDEARALASAARQSLLHQAFSGQLIA